MAKTPTTSPVPPLLVIVTGLSGAGNSTALAALADAGMYCIDNLPMEMLVPTIDLLEAGRFGAEHGLALCMDVRNKGFATKFPEVTRKLGARVRLEVIFLTAEDHALATRFSTTRRRHPLLGDGETLIEAIQRERELLGPVEESADAVFDTTNWTPQQLARAVEGRVQNDLSTRSLHITITSFGFKHGQLAPIDMLFDVRFLDNPYFVPELKAKSGLEPEVREFIFSRANATTMLAKMEDMLRFLVPLFYQEGKHYLRIGIGCTGGRHRSVCFAEELGRKFLAKPMPHAVLTILHRDIEN
jgi:UPF0042 nucleotide-binding protein